MKYKRIQRFNIYDKIRIFKILSIVLIIIFIFLIPITIQKLIKITKIECITQYGACSQQFQLGDYKTVKSQIERKLRADIQVNNFLIQYKIPSTIKIEVNLKKQKFTIKNENNYYFISSEGQVLSINNESSLPYLNKINIEYKIGDSITDQDKFALNLIEKVGFLYSILGAVSDDKELKIIIADKITVRFPLEGDVDVLVGNFRLIFSRLNDESEGIRMSDISEIDLRFVNPILRR